MQHHKINTNYCSQLLLTGGYFLKYKSGEPTIVRVLCDFQYIYYEKRKIPATKLIDVYVGRASQIFRDYDTKHTTQQQPGLLDELEKISFSLVFKSGKTVDLQLLVDELQPASNNSNGDSSIANAAQQLRDDYVSAFGFLMSKFEEAGGAMSRTPSTPFNIVHHTHVNVEFEWSGETRVEDTLQLVKLLGHGSFGEVWLAIHRSIGFQLAVKLLSPHKTQQASLEQEIRILKQCKNANIVAYYGMAGPDSLGRTWIMMDYCRFGSISSIIEALLHDAIRQKQHEQQLLQQQQLQQQQHHQQQQQEMDDTKTKSLKSSVARKRAASASSRNGDGADNDVENGVDSLSAQPSQPLQHPSRSSKRTSFLLTEPQLAYIMQQTLLALAYLHSRQILHRDIKGGNILVTADGKIKLADFGVSQFMKRKPPPIPSKFAAAHGVIDTSSSFPCPSSSVTDDNELQSVSSSPSSTTAGSAVPTATNTTATDTHFNGVTPTQTQTHTFTHSHPHSTTNKSQPSTPSRIAHTSDDYSEKIQSIAGSPYWMAPEIAIGEIGKKSDIWALGITLIELSEHRVPHHDQKNLVHILLAIKNSKPPELRLPHWSPLMRDFLEACVTKDIAKRPDAVTLLSHPWLSSFPIGASVPSSSSSSLTDSPLTDLCQRYAARENAKKATRSRSNTATQL